MSMSVQPVGVNSYNYSNVAFKGGEETPKKKGSVGKAIASGMLPGLGQACDGRYKSGIKHFLGVYGLAAVSKVLTAVTLASGNKIGRIAAGVAAVGAAIGSVASYIHGITDAYKGDKKA